jgi:O-methyltransferase
LIFWQLDFYEKKGTGMINFYRKLRWVIRNYSKIDFSHKLIPTEEMGVPSIFLGPITYATDSLVTSNNSDFIKETRFKKAYATAQATSPWDGFTSQWRVYIVCWFADMVKDLEGHFVECGVNTGAYSRAVIDYIEFEKLRKTFFLLDTFEGLDASQITDKEKVVGIQDYLTHYRDVYEQVKETFSGFHVKLIKGIVPGTLKECDAAKICYLSIDMNSVVPEIAAASFFWDRIVKGGVIILDDYGFPMHIHQKIAFDEFARQRNQSILCLPTGQGVIIKK